MVGLARDEARLYSDASSILKAPMPETARLVNHSIQIVGRILILMKVDLNDVIMKSVTIPMFDLEPLCEQIVGLCTKAAKLDKRSISRGKKGDIMKYCIACLRNEFGHVGLVMRKVRPRKGAEKYKIELDDDVIETKDKVDFGPDLDNLLIPGDPNDDANGGESLVDYEHLQSQIQSDRRRVHGDSHNFLINKKRRLN